MLKNVMKWIVPGLVVASSISVATAQKPVQAQPVPRQPAAGQRIVETPRNAEQVTGQPVVTQHTQEGNLSPNQMMAFCLATTNQEEIALTKFALEHIQNPELKAFAQMLHDDHTKFAAKLSKFAPEAANSELDRATDRRESSRTTRPSNQAKVLDNPNSPNDVNPPPAAAAKNSPAGPVAGAPETEADKASRRQTVTAAHSGSFAPDRMLHIGRQVASECLSLTEKALTEAKEKGKFDEAFLGSQWGAHIGMMAKLNVYEGESEGELTQVIQEAQTMTQQHTEKLKELCEKMDTEHKTKNDGSENTKRDNK